MLCINMRTRVCPFCGCRSNFIEAKRCEACGKRLSKISGAKPLLFILIFFLAAFGIYKAAGYIYAKNPHSYFAGLSEKLFSSLRSDNGQEETPAATPKTEKQTSVSKEDANKPDTSNMVFLSSATYQRGSKYRIRRDELPVKDITLSAFYIDVNEVTVEDYAACVQKGVCKKPEGTGCLWGQEYNKYPINCVTWNDALAYCNFKNKQLPTEAQWEYAARAGSSENFSFGNDYLNNSSYLWYKNNSGEKLHEVKTTSPNAFGIYDMHGNINEWVQDWYLATAYQSDKSTDPAGPASGKTKVLRGGSALDTALNVKSARRYNDDPKAVNMLHGFRCALNVEPEIKP